ncbi:WG repeat-containing protein [Brevibacillus sp. WF146]|uniref:WG repeat-containing protein n=1 Tax=Brevibacillus sp. WF146 TaxID=319501 RepID=UPI0007ECEAD4|nr:WG repeat-containing protein [Brevibacillus sp. WF146]UYZ11575.1 WG repeat-containing protein [Brevibacillus sp. WF146]
MKKYRKNCLNMVTAGVLAWSSVGLTAAAESVSFQDVSPAYWGYDTIRWGVEQRLISGFPDHTFRPDQFVKESEFLAMLLRYYANRGNALTLQPAGTYWADVYYRQAEAYHWPVSREQSDRPIKRGSVAKLIAASQGFRYDTNNAVQYLYNQGLVKGRGETASLTGFAKESYLTRTEAVQFIKNLADNSIVQAKQAPDQPSAPLIPPSAKLYPFTQNGKWGYMDAAGRVLVDPQFSNARPFREGLGAVYLNGKWGFVGANGELAIPLQFDDVKDFSEGLAAVRVGYKYGYINQKGQWVINPVYPLGSLYEYDRGVDFHEGFAVVAQGNKYAFINKSGKVVTAAYDEVMPFREGLAAVRVGNLWGYIDTTGKLAVKPQFDIANDFHEGLAAVARNGRYGYIGKTGAYVIKPQFSVEGLNYNYSGAPRLFDFHEGLALVMINGKYGYIDKTGKTVIPPAFDSRNQTGDYATDFSDGLALVRVGYRFGYIDKTGKMVIPAQFDAADPFSEGLARVRIKGKDGFIDKTGTFVIPPQFSNARSFQDGLALVTADGSNDQTYIDKRGNRVTE